MVSVSDVLTIPKSKFKSQHRQSMTRTSYRKQKMMLYVSSIGQQIKNHSTDNKFTTGTHYDKTHTQTHLTLRVMVKAKQINRLETKTAKLSKFLSISRAQKSLLDWIQTKHQNHKIKSFIQRQSRVVIPKVKQLFLINQDIRQKQTNKLNKS